MKKIRKTSRTEFKKEVQDYRQLIASNYNCRRGDRWDRGPAVKGIVKLFRNRPPKSKNDFLYIALRTLSRKSDDSRFTEWSRVLADELVTKLEKTR